MAQSELNFLTSVVPVVLEQFTGALNAPYVGFIITNTTASVLHKVNTDSIAAINLTLNSIPQSTLEFLQIWANATTAPVNYGAAMTTFPLMSDTNSSLISLTSSQTLWSSVQPLSLLDESSLAASTWFGAENGNDEAKTALAATFGLSSSQLTAVLNWRVNVKAKWVNDAVVLRYNLANLSDLGYKQWGMGVTESFKTLLPVAGLPYWPEFSAYATNQSLGISLDVNTSKAIISGPDRLTNLTNLIVFLTALSAPVPDVTTLTQKWGLSPPVAGGLWHYLQASAFSVINPARAVGGDIFTTRTVDQWLWSGVDPLLKLAAPETQGYAALFVNHTSDDHARDTQIGDLFYTGNSDIKLLNEYILDEGESSEDVWASKEQVGGTDGTQFAPWVDNDEQLFSWISEVVRGNQFYSLYLIIIGDHNRIRSRYKFYPFYHLINILFSLILLPSIPYRKETSCSISKRKWNSNKSISIDIPPTNSFYPTQNTIKA